MYLIMRSVRLFAATFPSAHFDILSTIHTTKLLEDLLKYISGIVAVLAALYYVFWFIRAIIRRKVALQSWLKILLNPLRHQEAAKIARRALHTRLSTSLVSTSAQWLTVFRLALIIAVLWRWIRLRVLDPPWTPDIGRDLEPWLTLCLLTLTSAYIFVAHFSRRMAEHSQKTLANEESDESRFAGGGVWSNRYPDVFFFPATIDVFYVLVASCCLPGISETHLGFFVPVAAAWLFRAEGRAIIIWLSIAIALYIQWHWTGYLITGVHWWTTLPESTPVLFEWGIVFVGNTLPRILFWFLVCSLMMVMRAVRRNAEEQAGFFHTLAEALPFEVFVKDRSCQFVFVNKKLLTKLKQIPGNQEMDLSSIQGKKDEELHLELDKVKKYREIDRKILDGEIEFYQEFEVSYAHGSNDKIETIKVPIFDRHSSVAYILGLCRDPLTETDLWFFQNILGARNPPICFFRKRNGRFVWVNHNFAIDAGYSTSEALIGLRDRDLYHEDCALLYEQDDRTVTSNGSVERDEWHEPLRQKHRRRVSVIKIPVFDSHGKPDGIRGVFYDVHSLYTQRISIETALCYMGKLIFGWRKTLNKASFQSYIPSYSEIQLRAYFISKEIGRANDLTSEQCWHLAEAELINEHRTGMCIDPMLEELIYLRGMTLLQSCVRLLCIGEYELTKISIRDVADLFILYQSMPWTPAESNPMEAINELIPLFRIWFPNIIIDPGVWDAETTQWIDLRWFQVGVAGLWFYSASLSVAQKNTAPIYCTLFVTSRNGRRELCVSVSDYSNEEQSAFSPLELSQCFENCQEGKCMGLQIALRVATLCGGEIQRSMTNHGPVLEFWCPLSV